MVRGPAVYLPCAPIGLQHCTKHPTCVDSEVPPYHEDHRQDQACNGLQGAVLLLRVFPTENFSWRRKPVSQRSKQTQRSRRKNNLSPHRPLLTTTCIPASRRECSTVALHMSTCPPMRMMKHTACMHVCARWYLRVQQQVFDTDSWFFDISRRKHKYKQQQYEVRVGLGIKVRGNLWYGPHAGIYIYCCRFVPGIFI